MADNHESPERFTDTRGTEECEERALLQSRSTDERTGESEPPVVSTVEIDDSNEPSFMLLDPNPETTAAAEEASEEMSRFWREWQALEEARQLKEGFYSAADTPRHFLDRLDIIEHHSRDAFPHSRLMDLSRHHHHRRHHHHKQKHRLKSAEGRPDSESDTPTSPQVLDWNVGGSPLLTDPSALAAATSHTSLDITPCPLACSQLSTRNAESGGSLTSIRSIMKRPSLRTESDHAPGIDSGVDQVPSVAVACPETVAPQSSTGPGTSSELPADEAVGDITNKTQTDNRAVIDTVSVDRLITESVEVGGARADTSGVVDENDGHGPVPGTEQATEEAEEVEEGAVGGTVVAASASLEKLAIHHRTSETRDNSSPARSISRQDSAGTPVGTPSRHVGFYIGDSPDAYARRHSVRSQRSHEADIAEAPEDEGEHCVATEIPAWRLAEDLPPSLSQVASSIHLHPMVTFSLGSEAEAEKSDTTPAEFRFGGRMTPHEHIPTHRDLERRRAPGSQVRLHDAYSRRAVVRHADIESDDMSESARDELAAHRYEDPQAMRMRRVETGQPNGSYEPATMLERVTRPADHDPHEMFVEMDELVLNQEGLYEWKQKSRWIMYEEDVLEGAERWGKPHVSTVSFHSMLELRKCIETGTVMLDLDEGDLQGIANAVVDRMIANEHLNPKHRGDIISSLLLKHTFMEDKKGFLRKNSHAYIGIVDLEEGKTPEAKVDGMFGTRKYRFSEPYISLKDATVQGKPGEGKMPEKVNVVQTNGVGIVDAESFPDLLYIQNKALQLDDEGVLSHRGSLKRSHALAGSTTSIKVDLDLMKKIPKGAQTTSVLVGTLDYLEKPVMAFVRLSRGRYLGNFTQVPLPVRFVFLLMGPRNYDFEYTDVGRSISTLMADKRFHEVAYRAETHQDLLRGLNEFLDDSIVLPPGELDKRTLLPFLNMAKEKIRKRKVRRAAREKAIEAQKKDEAEGGEPDKPVDPLARTGRLFGGMLKDMRKRFPLYWSDIRDGLNMQCLSTFIFIYFAALSPAITFGGLLQDKVDNWMGVTEMLLGCCISGVIFHLVAAQPLLIVGFTGPLLVFESAFYEICGSLDVEYMAFRVWVGIWLTIITVLVICFELTFVLRFISRFTEEVFSAFISLIFIIEVFIKLASIFKEHPLRASYEETTPQIIPSDDNTTDVNEPFGNMTTMAPGWYDENGTFWANETTTMQKSMPTTSATLSNQPNTALLSLILTIATFAIAYYLRIFRNGKILGRSARRALGDFGVPLAILIMVVVDILIKEAYTEKLSVPDGLEVSDPSKRGWFIPAFGSERKLPIWTYFAACVPAFLVFILIFMESMITTIIVSKKMAPDNKGPGYQWTMMVIGLFGALCGIMGLPFLTAGCVRSVTHTNALQVFGNSHAPGDKPVLQEVKEQRVTGFLVAVVMGVSVLLGPVLRKIPLPVLFGVFLYIGVASTSGVQFFDRLWLVFKPVKYHPDIGYVKKVRTWKMHMFTFIQIVVLAALWVIKSTPGSLAFPFVLIMLVPVRKFLLPKFFSQEELDELDKGDQKAPNKPIVYDSDEDDDFYTEMHKAI